ncbi:MAG: putative oxidoreductase [Myxococcales bacterium]|nr:putative oxidoreductase [Myxococcales bacterium]
METRLLGETGLRVSALSFGAMSFGGVGGFSAVAATQLDEARTLVDQCLEAGVNLFDTADIYSAGRSEEILGAALGARRSRVIIATKLHARMSDDPNDVGLSRHHIVRACEASLERLGTDWIDLYQVHGYDGLVAVDETLRALDDLVRAGKVRYLGCSNFSGWQLVKSLAASDARGLSRYCALQAYYSLVGRDLEHELVPACVDQRVGVLVWSPLAFGFLGGKYRRGEAAPADARLSAWGTPGTIDEQSWAVLEALRAVAERRNVSTAQVALNWLLHRPAVTSVIVGARNGRQLADNLQATTWRLGDDELATLDRVSERPLPYPYWHQKKYNGERTP